MNITDKYAGKLYYLTGGTHGVSRFVSYDQRRWDKSIAITREILSYHGVDKGMRVVVAQPFAPWAIGEIFSRASFGCGADVYSFGLYLEEPAFRELVYEIDPDFICATASNLIRWKQANTSAFTKSTRCFVAGEPLNGETRDACSKLWNGAVINIYGMSEFDTVATQVDLHYDALILVPSFYYAIADFQKNICDLSEGVEGELLIQEFSNHDWHRTGDIVKVLKSNVRYLNSDKLTHAIKFVRRCDDCMFMPDGTIIDGNNLEIVRQCFPSIRRLQLLKTVSNFSTQLTLYIVDGAESKPDAESIRQTLFKSNLELLDCCRHGIIQPLEILFVEEASLIRTPRGKYPVFVNNE